MYSSEEDYSLESIFPEPPKPPTPEPTTTIYTLDSASGQKEIEIRLVGSHPLWGHHLWNASRAFATYLNSHPALYRDKYVLELGAGGGLPSIVVGLGGVRMVVVTDYPDKELIYNLDGNVNRNLGDEVRKNVNVQGYIWGHSVEPLLSVLPSDETRVGIGGLGKKGFDLIIMSDLIFNHSQHDALLKTCDLALAYNNPPPSSPPPPPPSVLVFYTHHRPHLAQRDMQFFVKARDRGWVCEEVVTEKFLPMFPEDPGEEEVRSTVHGWRMTRSASG